MSRPPETALELCLRAERQRVKWEARRRPETLLGWAIVPLFFGMQWAGATVLQALVAIVAAFALGLALSLRRTRAVGGGSVAKGLAEAVLPKTILEALEDGTYEAKVPPEAREALDRCAALATSVGATVFEEAVGSGLPRAERRRYRTLSRSASALMASAFAALARPLLYRAEMGEPEREALRAAERGLASLRDEADRMRRRPRPRPDLPPQSA